MAADSDKESLAAWEGGIPAEERIHHETLFFSQGPVSGYLTGERARDLFLHSRLPLTVLSKIWNLADTSNDNLLSVEEFVLAMHLILKVKTGVSVPKTLPKHLVPKVVNCSSLPDMSPADKDAYQNVFKTFDTELTGYIDAIQGRQLLVESGLSVEELCKLWDVGDIDKDGQLNVDEWAVICHLIRALKQGVNISGPVDVFRYLPHRLPPNSYHSRKQRVDSYDKQKNHLMTLKEKRKAQITNENRRLELLRRRFALHKELYETVKKSGKGEIPEAEFQLYKEKEELNIEKVEEIVYRLKKEHERVRQETVKVILGEQGSLQVDARLVKEELSEIHTRQHTGHTKATKDPDPFHQLYEQRKEDRKKSTLSEGEEPEIHHPFLISPFDENSLSVPVSGKQIFLNPDPSLYNNNTKNSHKGRELFEKLHNFGDGFLEEWSTHTAKDSEEDTDPIFMSLHVPMEPKVWAGLQWSGDRKSEGDRLEDLHRKLVDLKSDFEKLNEDTGGQLLFRNPEDYLARRKAQEEEDRLEKSKQRREKRSLEEKAAKRRSYHVTTADTDLQKPVRDKYKYNRRSLNIDKKFQETGSVQEKPKRPDKPPQRTDSENRKAQQQEQLNVKTAETFAPQQASSPRSAISTTSSATSPQGHISEIRTSTRASSTPQSQPSRKKKAAPPPPSTPPVTSPATSPRSLETPASPVTPASTANSASPTSPESPAAAASPSKIPQPASKGEQPNRPPRRKRIGSKENQSFLHRSFEQEQEKATEEKKSEEETQGDTLDQKVDVTVKVISVSEISDKVLESEGPGVNVKLAPNFPESDTLASTETEAVPQSNIDDIITESEISKVTVSEEQATPNANVKQQKEEVQLIKKKSDPDEIDIIVPTVISVSKPDFEKLNQYGTGADTEVVAVSLKQETVRPDSPVEETVEAVHASAAYSKPVEEELDEPDAYLDHVTPIAFQKKDDLSVAFRKFEKFPEVERSRELSDNSSDTGSEAPPLPESLPPPLPTSGVPDLQKVSSLTEISETVEVMETVPVETAPPSKKMEPEKEMDEIPDDLSPASPRSLTSPIADLQASMFSMRVSSPSREGRINGGQLDAELKIDTKMEDSDISDDEENGITGTFCPGDGETRDVPTEMNTEDDGGIQLISYSAKLNSPNSDHSQPDSAFEDMQSSMTSNDPLSNTLDDIPQEEFVISEKVEKQEAAPKSKDTQSKTPVRSFELSLDDSQSTPGKHGLTSPPGGSNFMQRAKDFANFVQKPPKMIVTRKREITSPDDLTDERYLELEAERRAVISSSTMKKRDMDKPLSPDIEDMNNEDTGTQKPRSPEPDETVREWRAEVSTRSKISWDEKPEKVNLYSENIIQESDNTETVDRESIANLSTTRKQWETILKTPNKEDNPSTSRSNQRQVRHWEVKLPTPLKKVPAKQIVKQDSDSDGDSNMADTEFANESAIEREIRLAMEREEMLKKEKEDRAALQAKQAQSPQKPAATNGFPNSEQNNNDKPSYHEMTEADRGAELDERAAQIQQELEEQKERELALNQNTNSTQESSEESSAEDENASESIIEREIRIQRQREEELLRNRPLKSPSTPETPSDEEEEVEQVVEEIEEVVIEVTETVPSESSISTPDNLSDTETTPVIPTRQRISYEEAIANTNHDGESLIARELREAREREEELAAERKNRLSGSIQTPPAKQGPVAKTPDHVPKAGTYQKHVSPYKETVRKDSLDTLSSSSTGKSPDVAPQKFIRAPTSFEARMNQRVKTPPEPKQKGQKKETTIEREIRLARERENEFRQQRGLPPLQDEKKVEISDDEDDYNGPVITRGCYNRPVQQDSQSIQRFASSKLQQEIKKQSEIESKYRAEGKIVTTSEDHVGLVNFSELSVPAGNTVKPKRNFVIPKKETASPVQTPPHENGTSDSPAQLASPAQQTETPKYRRSVSGGGLHFSYKESRHKAESKIEQELREMREREEELRNQRSGSVASPRNPDSPRSPSTVVTKRSQFEQTT